MVACCPTCGTILSENIFGRTKSQRIFDFISRHPNCTLVEVTDYVYADDPDGGPESNSVGVLIHMMQKKLKQNGLLIQSRRGPGGTYKVVEYKEPALVPK